MIENHALVVYKNKPALVKEKADGKFTISLQDGSCVKVRDKDIELIHPGPVKDFNGIDDGAVVFCANDRAVREAWELLSDEGAPFSLKDLASLVFGNYTPSSAYAAYSVLRDGLYFSGDAAVIVLRGKDEVAAEEAKRGGKQRETDERAQFLQRIRTCLK